MKRGTVVLALLPFTDLTDRKRRPALVVSPETRQGDDLLVAFITSYRGETLAPTRDLLIPLQINRSFALRYPGSGALGRSFSP